MTTSSRVLLSYYPLKACRNNDVAVKKTEGNTIIFIFMIRLHFGKKH